MNIPNIYVAYTKILKVIDSCITYKQCSNAYNMITMFNKIYTYNLPEPKTKSIEDRNNVIHNMRNTLEIRQYNKYDEITKLNNKLNNN